MTYIVCAKYDIKAWTDEWERNTQPVPLGYPYVLMRLYWKFTFVNEEWIVAYLIIDQGFMKFMVMFW